ncbi:hypothetical protein AAVH_39227, partial [Aphelenchoides avenae]
AFHLLCHAHCFTASVDPFGYGVTGLEPLHGFENFTPARRFFDAWISRAQGPFVPEKVEPNETRYYDNTTTMSDASGIRWTKDTRTHFTINLPDETLDRLGLALGLNVSYTHVEVVFTMDVLEESRLKHVLPSLDAVDAYIIFVANSTDVGQSRVSFLRYDRKVVSHCLHATKWASRHALRDGHCAYDVCKKAFDALAQPGGSLSKVNWSESELNILAVLELRSRRPAMYVVDVPREVYMRQDPVFLASTEEWVHRSLLGEAPSAVVLTSLDLEEEVARHNGRHVASVYDGILGQ